MHIGTYSKFDHKYGKERRKKIAIILAGNELLHCMKRSHPRNIRNHLLPGIILGRIEIKKMVPETAKWTPDPFSRAPEQTAPNLGFIPLPSPVFLS